MDIQERANAEIDKLDDSVAPEQVSRSAAIALWEIVKLLDHITDRRPQRPEL